MLTKVRTHPAPNPLPATWARAIANSITRRLRKPWSPSKATRALSNTTRGGHSTASKIKPPHPTVEVLFSQPYAMGTIPPSTKNGHPRLIWHLAQTRMIGAIPEHQRHLVEQYLRRESTAGPDPEPFRSAGTTLRRSESTDAETAEVMLRITGAAVVVTCDEGSYQRALSIAEFEDSQPVEWQGALEGILIHALDRLPESPFVV